MDDMKQITVERDENDKDGLASRYKGYTFPLYRTVSVPNAHMPLRTSAACENDKRITKTEKYKHKHDVV